MRKTVLRKGLANKIHNARPDLLMKFYYKHSHPVYPFGNIR